MKSKFLFATLLLALTLSVFAGEGWLTDFEEAKKQAAEKQVPILADFSGSNWCGWCVKLDQEVFSKSAFKKYAKDNLVLLLLDFPRPSKQSPELKKQNRGLIQKYEVRGFPTVLLLDKNGKVINRTNYQPGGASKYVKHLKELLKKK